MKDTRKCFVISPIGAEGSEVREHADDVFDFIVKPAMDKCKITAVRSDHLREPGTISEHMFSEILSDQLCVAVLTHFNPNVFYELAIAQAAARPVIILLEKGNSLPFDVQDLRCVYYDLKPRPLKDKVYVNEIVEHMKSLESTGWRARSPIADHLGATFTGTGQVKFFENAQSFGREREWLQLLESTEDVFEIMGVGLNSWRKTEGFGDLLEAKAHAGCQVRILLMHEDNPALPELNRRGLRKADYAQLIANIDAMKDYFLNLCNAPNIELRQMRRGCLHYQLSRTDQYAVAVQYFYGLQPGSAPVWQAAQGTKLYDWSAREFEMLWHVNSPPAADVSDPSDTEASVGGVPR